MFLSVFHDGAFWGLAVGVTVSPLQLEALNIAKRRAASPYNATIQGDINRVNSVTDILQEGEEVLVKCIDVDKSGKIRLSRRAALGEALGGEQTAQA